MKKPEELSEWDFPDTKYVPDGYHMTSIPQSTDDNFNKLLSEYNKLVVVVNLLSEKVGIEFDGDE